MKWLIIGISGPTCSGKTSVAKKVHENIKGSILINQDAYFLTEDDPRHVLIPELNHFNWEILSSLDMSKMYTDIKNIIETSNEDIRNGELDEKFKFLIIEGFLLYNYKPIADLCDKKYFIDIDKKVCWDRRKNRVYNPPDVPGYFDKVVWPEYLRHKEEISSNKTLYETTTFLDGTKPINELYDEVIDEIKHCLN
ncbi:hypothetical protein TSAR_005245 [Trichomalopsis sarcophagae]|uniref:Phosphoribulokinase/uridine kinase domain-containing protein n=1 Tax=Trichomalopsis sarcophagae TaxID=543379 RepID=A0A232ETR7_9HYME|nr:hypothetical protein TSAR_005245 [Trichomalopsis sarcophagae]